MLGFRVCVAIGAVVLLSGCLPLSVYYREGAQVSRIDSDLTRCEVSALNQVPVRIIRRYISPVYKHKKVCNSLGQCTSHRVLVTPGRWESYDANEGLRGKVTNQFMLDKGYARVQVQACTSDVIHDTTIRATKVQPPLTKQSCAIRIKGGRYQIVTP